MNAPFAKCLVLLSVVLLAACSPSAALGPEPTYPSAPLETLATATPQPTVPAGTPQPTATPGPTAVPIVAGQPVARRSDIRIRKLVEIGPGFVRMDKDPITGQIYYMDGRTNIYRLELLLDDTGRGELAYNAEDVGVGEEFVAAGMAFAPDGTLYLLGNVTPEDGFNQAIIRRGRLQASGERSWSTLATTAPYEKSNTQFDHVANGISVSPDGKYLFMNNGSRTDHGEIQAAKGLFPDLREVPLTSAIFRIPTDRDDQLLPNDEDALAEQGYLYADGLRNAYDMVFAPNGDLIAGDNGPDADYPEELNWIREGQHYGFPWVLGNLENLQQFEDYDAQQDGRLQGEFYAVQNDFYQLDATFPQPPEGVSFTAPIVNLGPDADQFVDVDGSVKDASDLGLPSYTFTPHRSPLGLVFDLENALGSDLTGSLLVLSWGAAAGDIPDVGRDLLAAKLSKNGDSYQATMTQLVAGFDQPIDGVLIGKKLYVLDWGGKGTLWEVSLP